MYFGSVRFFRHLIITVLLLFIAVPVFFAVRFGINYNKTAGKLAEVQNVVKHYTDKNATEDQLVEDLSAVLDKSFYRQIPTFQLQVDNAVSTQLGALETRIVNDVDILLSEIKADFNETLDSKLITLSANQAQLQKQLTEIKTLMEDIEQHLMKQADDNTQTLQDQFSTLSDQIAELSQQIDELYAEDIKG